MNNTLKKVTKVAAKSVLTLGLGLATIVGTAFFPQTNYVHRKVAQNIMSHSGYKEYDTSNILKKPSTYCTRGHYRGFVNLINRESGVESEYSYDIKPSFFSADPNNKLSKEKQNLDLNAIYLELDNNTLPESGYKPTKLKESDKITFNSIKDYFFAPQRLVGNNLKLEQEQLDQIINLKEGEALSWNDIAKKNSVKPGAYEFTNVDLHEYTLSFGRDKKGVYSSVYDSWDFEKNDGYFRQLTTKDGSLNLATKILPHFGKAIHFYDRVYWDDFNSTNKIQNAGLK